MPFDRSKYPDNWEEISNHIRFERAGGQCEWFSLLRTWKIQIRRTASLQTLWLCANYTTCGMTHHGEQGGRSGED